MHEYDDYFAAPWPPERKLLSDLRDEICTDAYGGSEQVGAFVNAIDEWAELPVQVELSDGSAFFIAVEDRDVTLAARLRLTSGTRLSVPLEDVRPPDASPAAFLVAAYRLWLGLPPLPQAPEPVEEERDAPDGWEEVKDRLLTLGPIQLVDLLGELYAAGHANRASIHERLGLQVPDPQLDWDEE